jgi:transposase
VPDPKAFSSGRHFAWLGLVPRQNSSGGKSRLGRISKQSGRYIRQLLILGAAAILRSSIPGCEIKTFRRSHHCRWQKSGCCRYQCVGCEQRLHHLKRCRLGLGLPVRRL